MPYGRKGYRKAFKASKGTKRNFKRRSKFSHSGYRTLSKRISAVSRRVAGEVYKFETTPANYTNSLVVVGTSKTDQTPLNTISSGVPWVMPLNWTYWQCTGSATGNVYIDGVQRTVGETITASFRNPLWFNTGTVNADNNPSGTDAHLFNDASPGLQYRMKYLYINALFNASINSSVNNTDGALRIVIVKDKQPTGGAATWADSSANGANTSRGVFNQNRIDAQLNPNTVGRFKIMYDKTLRFNNTNGYKPFKYFKQLSTTVRNARDLLPVFYYQGNTSINNNSIASAEGFAQSSSEAPPVLKNAFYLMIFSDGLNFTYSTDATTPAAGFHLFNRIAYYNN